MSKIRLIVGLGNPGPQYTKTRHNAGFWFLEQLSSAVGATLRADAKFHGLVASVDHQGGAVKLLAPTTFMNRSGLAVSALCRFWKITAEETLVVHDELDFESGVVKLKQGGGHGGHNGLRDIIAQLGSPNFFRLRLGIGHPGNRDLVVPYVLGDPSKSERSAIDTAISRSLSGSAFGHLLNGDLSRFNQDIQSA